MAFSKDFELEIDSSYRLSNSTSSTNFQYGLPYSFPTVKGQTRITLSSAFVPQSFYNIPQIQLFNYVGVGPGLSFIIPAGHYTGAQLASTMQTLATAASFTSLTISYSASTGKFTFLDSAASYPLALGAGVTTPFFDWLGFSGFPTSINIVANVPKISDVFANLNLEREERLYVRIGSLDNKIMLPWNPSQIFTYAIPLLQINPNGYFTYVGQDDRQTLFLSENQLRANSFLNVQLVWEDGTVVDLNGRNWKIVLKIEQDDNKMFY